jgi:spore photoproduct lyase
MEIGMRLGTRGSNFIRQFGGPGEDSQIVCFRFWQLVVAGGCPYRCSYCFLQTVPWFRFRPEELYGLVYTNVDDMVGEIEKWLADPTPKMMIAGELQDGLVFDSAYKKATGKPLTHHIIPLFAAQKRHRLIFLTKSTQIGHALELKPTPQVVFSWSVNAEEVAAKWEHGAPLPSERFAAAKKMKKAGWPIRFRLDPMIPYPDWKKGYSEAIRKINAISPEMVTLGALRATSYNGLKNASKANGRDESIFEYLTEEKDPSGFKYRIPFAKQVEMFRFAAGSLKGNIKPALCKEDKALWKVLGMKFDGCHCLLGRQDGIVKERYTEMKHAKPIEHIAGLGKSLPIVA